jgi:hypothetical protein
MSLIEDFSREILQAYKTGETQKRILLQTLKASLLKSQKDLGRDLEAEDETRVLKSELKIREQSREDYQKGSRDDLTKQADWEISVIKKYLPEQLGDEEIEKAVQDAISSGEKDFGKIMKEVMAKIGEQADGSRVAGIVKKKLNG